MPQSTPSPGPPLHNTGRSHTVRFHFAGHFLGQVGSFTGIPIISAAGKVWIEDCTGLQGSADKICGILPDWQAILGRDQTDEPPDMTLPHPSSGAAGLPARRVIEHQFALFRSTNFAKTFCLWDPVLFRHTLNVAYGAASSASQAAKAHVFAFMLMTAECQHEWNNTPKLDEKRWESQVSPLIPHIIGQSDVISAQTFLMLAIYYLFRAQEDRGLMYQNIACRHLMALGAHVHPLHRSEQEYYDQEEISRRTKQHLRRLFWVAYWSDAELCLRTGRPPAFDDDYCDLTLPFGQEELKMDAMDVDFTHDSGSGNNGYSFNTDVLKLATIKSRIGKGLYSVSALRKTDSEILCAVRELDDELELWRTSVPEAEQPSLGAEPQSASFGAELTPRNMWGRKVMMRLQYLHLMAIIHQASSRCRTLPAAGDGAEGLWGISSSMAISLHASRETLQHVRSTFTSLGVMRGMLFYPMMAALNIFCNILLDPLGPTVTDDLDLVKSTAELVKDLSKGAAVVGDEHWRPDLEIFITEFARLGQCAIDRARILGPDYYNSLKCR
ncbi:fungal-specific transcription factor domain-containing protein [Plectosphaerella plurivora]|uniref:Fungal-specific transcription factor domain-containing protein n=1 Tax=Plectosphaerella plurivora TaxID=936078 RepID=A0A9P8VAC0_9PEZI|nr:fungal-specific transcription factor domain-containing protein [Plectosphaerella plurivora]